MPLQGWEMPQWHVAQLVALLEPAGSLQQHCSNRVLVGSDSLLQVRGEAQLANLVC